MTAFKWYLAVTGLLTMLTVWWLYGVDGAYWKSKENGDYIGAGLAPYIAAAPAALFVGGIVVKGVIMVLFH